MAVFDGVVKVPRAVPDPKRDKDLSSPGSLSWGGIKSAAGFAGANGADAKLIHGDRWQQIDGSQTELISANLDTTLSGNQTHSVQGNQTILVAQDHKETLVGNCLQTIIGPQIVANMDVRNETRAITHTHTHGDHFFDYGPDNKFHYCETNMGAYLFMFEAELEHTEVALHHLEFKLGAHNYFAGLDTSVCAVKSENSPVSVKAFLLAAAIKLAAGNIGATSLETQAIKVGLTPMEVAAGLHRSLGAAP